MFKEWLKNRETVFSEISKKDLGNIESRLKDFEDIESQPFNNIFGNKSRIVIPFSEPTLDKFTLYLTNNGLTSNVKTGLGKEQVQTQQGIKTRETKIGKFLNNLGKKDKEAGEWLSWWEKNKANITTPTQGVSIVVSRHPVDIVRMSDHDEFSSCHAPGREFFKCAVQEAKTGGAVAYVVRNSDLSKIENLQAQEIFKDNKRKIKGIEPLQRIRLRRFKDKNHDYLVPELKAYGIGHADFNKSLKNWAFNSQKDILSKVDFDSIKLHGGSYQDNNAGELWFNFVGKDFDKKLKSKDEEEEGLVNPENLYNQADKVVAQHKFKHYEVHFDLNNNDGDPVLLFGGSVVFNFEEKHFKKTPHYSDLRTYRLREKDNNTLGLLINDYLSIGENNEISFDQNNIIISFNGNNSMGGIVDLEEFLDEVDDLDRAYDQTKKTLELILIKKGFIVSDLDNFKFKNIKLENDFSQYGLMKYYIFKSPLIEIGNLSGIPKNLIYAPEFANKRLLATGKKYHQGSGFDSKLENDLINVFKLSPQLELGFYLTTNEIIPFDDKREENYGKIPINFQIYIKLKELKNNDLMQIKKIDDNYNKIIEYTKQWWNKEKTNLWNKLPHVQISSENITKESLKSKFKIAYNRQGEILSLLNPKTGQKEFYWKDNDIRNPIALKDAEAKFYQDIQKLRRYTDLLMHDGIYANDTFVKYDQEGNPTYFYSTYPDVSKFIQIKDENFK